MKKKKRHNYTDGVIRFYIKKVERNVRGMEDLECVSKLAYSEKSLRQADMEFAAQLDKRLTVKVVTPDDGVMDTERLAVMGGVLYAIIHIDRDRAAGELYFYLQEVRRID